MAERQYDDVVRVAPPPPDTRKTMLELNDKKSGKVRVFPDSVCKNLPPDA